MECLLLSFSTVLLLAAGVILGSPRRGVVVLRFANCAALGKLNLDTLKELFLKDEALRKLPVELFALIIQLPESEEPLAPLPLVIILELSASTACSKLTASGSNLGIL